MDTLEPAELSGLSLPKLEATENLTSEAIAEGITTTVYQAPIKAERNLAAEIDQLKAQLNDITYTLAETVKLALFLWKSLGNTVTFTELPGPQTNN